MGVLHRKLKKGKCSRAWIRGKAENIGGEKWLDWTTLEGNRWSPNHFEVSQDRRRGEGKKKKTPRKGKKRTRRRKKKPTALPKRKQGDWCERRGKGKGENVGWEIRMG